MPKFFYQPLSIPAPEKKAKDQGCWTVGSKKLCLRSFYAPVLLAWLMVASGNSQALTLIEVGADEDGSKTTGIAEIWHDPDKNKNLEQAVSAYANGEFKPLESAGSTGLAKGAFWSRFAVRNTTDQALQIQLEYVDHQAITLQAYAKSSDDNGYNTIADLSLYNAFSQRPVAHNRFVFELTLEPLATQDLLVRFTTEQRGYIFPGLRIWQPTNLDTAAGYETSLITFLFGGFFVMALFALIAGITTQGKMFYAYTVYCISKITVWGIILGYAHRYVVTEHFHWSYMSMGGAFSIFCGLVFARIVLRSRKHTPKLDIVLRLMMGNAVLVFLCGLFRLNALAVVLMTIAFLLYPTLAIVSFTRWRQGSAEALVLGLAWSILIISLVVQAMRDIGFVAHNFINYYAPPIGSFTEMLTIMIAMGIQVRKLQTQKDQAEENYRQTMERSKAELEVLVEERTKELADAKKLAESEARTDSLTGIHNRRNFLALANLRIGLAKRKDFPLYIMMLDIDHFKSINDSYGHYAGDTALIAFSREISNTIRESDIFGRVGGEEFALLLNEESSGALELAERVRERVENIYLSEAFKELKFTVSIGLARLDKQDTLESLMKKADTALYGAKKKGRNCVVEYSLPHSKVLIGPTT